MSKSPSLRRIQADIHELSIDVSDQYYAAPLENDMFEWHFTIRGAEDTDFSGGVYHGRILLPPEYPFKPPDIVFLTPSGRFETNIKVCLSFSSFHPELWQPVWGIRLILEALIGFLPTPADGALGALDWTKEERQKLARESLKFRCPVCCGENMTCVDLLPEKKPGKKGRVTKFHGEIEKLKMLQIQSHAVDKLIQDDGGKESKPKVETADTNEIESKSTELERTHLSYEKTFQLDDPETTPTQLTDRSISVESIGITDHSPPSTLAMTTLGQEVTITRENHTASSNAQSLDNSPLRSDHFLNGIIAALAIVVIVLFRNAQTLVQELRSLENES